ICFHEGTYYQKEPITIGTSDCDSYYTITYTNFNSENVRIVGGLPVTGWTDADGDGIFEADITGFGSVYALYENGVRLQNARETEWQNKPVRDPSHLQAIYGSATSWFGEVLKVSELTGDSIRTEYRKCDWSGSLQYLQGAREYISEPGEWAVEGNRIFYKPVDTASLETGEIVVGLADNLFYIHGEAENPPVRNIVISGLRLEMNASGENLIAHARANNVTGEYESNLKGLVCIRNAEHITVEHCQMSNAGYMAVVLTEYAQHNLITGNDIRNTGYAGMFLIGENPGSLNYCNKYNTIS
ncbi:MAG: hypothetical protein J6N32_11185, partial [Clostridia bacterium]|nr:hypothetical protein [Clostridia bacterium]